MKKEKLVRALSEVDEKYLEQALDARPKQVSRKYKIAFRALVAAALCISLLAGNLWMFLPYKNKQDLSEYKKSDYYPIIQKLSALTYKKSNYKNNFDKYVLSAFTALGSGLKGDAYPEGVYSPDGSVPENSTTTDGIFNESSGEKYEEVTDNQVEGVIEADMIKRTDKHIFYLYMNTLYIYSIEREDSKLVAQYKIALDQNTKYYFSSFCSEFYITNDAKTLILPLGAHHKENGSFVEVRAYDISDVNNIQEKGRISISGSLNTTRLVDNRLLIMSSFAVKRDPDYSVEADFIPQITTVDGRTQSIPIDKIVSPEKLTSTRYTAVCSLDVDTLNIEGAGAFLSYSDIIYVSNENIYATRSYITNEKEGERRKVATVTEIAKMPYKNGEFSNGGTVVVEGFLKDQYSLDEYEGILRVVTTTNTFIYDSADTVLEKGRENASLFCIDLENMSVASEVEYFAPEGESVRSVRFDGKNAYVCTAVQLTDPVFFFDLSDIDNISYKETGTIKGFSSSLVNFGNGYLLGIGVGENSASFKVEVYEESVDNVVSVCKYTIENAGYSPYYKSYHIVREEGLLGIGVSRYGEMFGDYYLILFFDGYELRLLHSQELDCAVGNMRGVFIDGYFYMFGGSDFAVKQLYNNKIMPLL